MSTTWIIILSLLGLVIVIVLIRYISYFLFSKNKKPPIIAFEPQDDATQLGYEKAILMFYNLLQLAKEIDNQKIEFKVVRDFFNKKLTMIANSPEIIFGSFLISITELTETIELFQKTAINFWSKKLVKESNFIEFKINEYKNNPQIQEFLKANKATLLAEWKQKDK